LRRRVALWYTSAVPRPRHVRLAIPAATAAVVLALAASGPFDAPGDAVPLGAVEEAAGAAAPRRSPRPAMKPVPNQPDPHGPLDELDGPLPASPQALTGYQWPLPKGRLTGTYGPSYLGSRVVDGEHFHIGIDLASFCGDRIVAAHDGVVLAAGRRYDQYMGWNGDLQPYFDRLDEKQAWFTLPIVVIVDDGNGYRSVYAHLASTAVEKGERVRAGQLIGKEGATGRAFGCHLHYELFSPLETATQAMDADLAKRLKLPIDHAARIDPLLVLPPRPDPTKPTPPPPTPPLPAPFATPALP
jgi:murein DD-endopeptidase MepM/ murein hydrolase activator NlpD